MALADIPTHGQPRRLDSWKEVAEYLGRDVRTATRWEAQGMPVHRVPGGKGTSVFAFSYEIDAWLAGNHPEPAGPALEEARTSPVQAPPAIPARRPTPVTALAGAIAVALTIAAIALGVGPQAGDAPLHVTATETDVSIATGSGPATVIHRFGPGRGVLIPAAPARLADLNADGEAEVLVGVSFYEDRAVRAIRHGELLNLSAAGAVRWRFGFDDAIRFRDETISGPWAVANWQEGPAASPAKVAVAAHDYIWWGSIVAILDHHGRRLSAFVNPGWIESLLWLDKDRLGIAGFSNARNEAMVALLNANDAGGQAPGSEGTPFHCTTCPAGAPLFYATVPRSELNQLTGARFNRASVELLGERVTVTSVEIENTTATAMYEFDRAFRLLRARYSEAYWDMHRRLELEGRLTHPRESCPERDGPPAIHVWAGTDWKRIAPPR